MGTRAVYTFTDADETQKVSVYKHWDGYPEGAAGFIEKAKAYAWELPRYEPDDFAAAFVAANKGLGGGDIRLIPQDVKPENFAGDVEYHYIITQTKKNHVLMVHAFHVNWWGEEPKSEHIISCSQEAFERHAKDWAEGTGHYAKKVEFTQ